MDAFVAILALAVLAAFLGVLLVGGWGFTAGRVREACCSNCKYPAAGLPMVRCPECGDDWMHHGVSQPGARILIRPSRLIRFMCRTVLLGVLVVPTYFHLAYIYPLEVEWVSLAATSPSGLFSSLHLRAIKVRERSDRRWRAYPTSPELELRVGGGRARLRIVDRFFRADIEGVDGHSTRTSDALTEQDVRAWMSSAGVDESSPAFHATAGEVFLIVRNTAVGGNTPGSSDDSRSISSLPITYTGATSCEWWMPAPRVLIPFVSVSLVLWMMLIWKLVWPGGRRRHPDP